jgi:hypothetical protein
MTDMEKIKLQDITFYRHKNHVTVPAGKHTHKERKRVDIYSLDRQNVLPGLTRFKGVVEGVIDREIDFWRLRKQKKAKSGEIIKIETHFSSECEAMKAYAKFKTE